MKKNIDEFAEIIGQVLTHTVNEPYVLNKLEKYFDPKPAQLANSEESSKKIEKRLQVLSEQLGGPPSLIIQAHNEKLKKYDTYSSTAVFEILSMFHRTRRSVCRAHMFYIGAETIKTHPEYMYIPKNESIEYYETIIDRYWEHAETAYLRLASLWDRFGQLIDFIFFNIREYERDGYPSVMNRIQRNFIPLYSQLGDSIHWKNLREYQNCNDTNGLGWLLRRRNLLIHSVHIRGIIDDQEKGSLFIGEFDHLREKHHNKLSCKSSKDELDIIHQHLKKAANLFSNVLGLCEMGIDIIGKKD